MVALGKRPAGTEIHVGGAGKKVKVEGAGAVAAGGVGGATNNAGNTGADSLEAKVRSAVAADKDMNVKKLLALLQVHVWGFLHLGSRVPCLRVSFALFIRVRGR